MAWRLAPLVGLLLGFAAVAWRAWWQTRRHGTSGLALFGFGGPGQHARDALLIALLLSLTGQAVAAAISPQTASSLSHALSPAARALAGPVGAALLFSGVALLLAAQLNLGASWRVGIVEAARPGLVTTGLYRFCRNPIFLFLIMVVGGFALLLPNWLSGATLLGTILGIRAQVRAEEGHLLRAYGEAYRAYARRVGRFSPWTGRLRP